MFNAAAGRAGARRQPIDKQPPAEPEISSGRRSERMQALEAVLLLAKEPLSTRKLSQYANLADGTEALTLIRQLNRFYDEEGRAFCVEQVAGGYQLMTRPVFADWLRRLAGTPAEVRLSVPAMETLAVVSYRQPVLRAEIEAIRGVACGEILRQLMERDLVRIQGRSEELGRPFLYGTTTRFLHVFGLASLDDLPKAETLRRFAPAGAAGEVTSNPQTTTGEGESVLQKEASVIVMEADEVMELAGQELAQSGLQTGNASPESEVAFDDDEELDDDLDDEEEDDVEDDEEDDDFDDDFDDDYEDDDEWDDDDEDEDIGEDEDEGDWEEVDDDDEWEEEDEEDDEDEDDEDWDIDDDDE